MLDDETVIVTGASGNLGAAVVRLLAARGARVVCVERSATAGEVEGADPGRILRLAGHDLNRPGVARAVVAEAETRFGRVTGLVNTVGGFGLKPVAGDGELEHWDRMMDLNARVAMVTSAAVLPALVAAGGGSIVHVAAGAALKAGAGQAAYAASKAAVIRLVEAIAAEHRADRISANCILPGTIDTPQNRAAMPDSKPGSMTPPDAIAELIAFLLSPAGRVVTGAAIPASGPV